MWLLFGYDLLPSWGILGVIGCKKELHRSLQVHILLVPLGTLASKRRHGCAIWGQASARPRDVLFRLREVDNPAARACLATQAPAKS